MKSILIETEDGSHTLFLPELNEHYHSTHGAIQESQYIFIQNGFQTRSQSPLNILEIGFGTGLNAWLTCQEASNNKQKVQYFTTELYPLNIEIIKKLNYTLLLSDYDQNTFQLIHEAAWGKKVQINEYFSIEKQQIDVTQYSYPSDKYFDLVYDDAFAPDKQPEMWSAPVLQRIVERMNSGAVFITYCAKGSIRRLLSSLGLTMERLPGPPGKKEILRGQKQ